MSIDLRIISSLEKTTFFFFFFSFFLLPLQTNVYGSNAAAFANVSGFHKGALVMSRETHCSAGVAVSLFAQQQQPRYYGPVIALFVLREVEARFIFQG